MLPPCTTLEHPFGVDDLDVRIPGGFLNFRCLSIWVSNDVGGVLVYVEGYLCTETPDP